MTTINLTNTTYDAKAETIQAIQFHASALRELITSYNQIVDRPNWAEVVKTDLSEVEAYLIDFVKNTDDDPDIDAEI